MNNKLHIKQFFSSYFLTIILFVFVLLYLPIKTSFENNVLISLQFLLIGLFSAFGIIESSIKHPYSLTMIFWFFNFLFMFCGGISQYANNAFRWRLIASNEEIIQSNIIIVIGLIGFYLANHTNKVISFGHRRGFEELLNKNISLPKNFMTLLIIILLAIGIKSLLTNGIDSLFLRSSYGSGAASEIESQATRTLLSTVIRAVSMCILTISVCQIRARLNSTNTITLLLAIIIVLLNVPFFGVARYALAAVYGGTILFSFKFATKPKVILYALMVSLLFLFPLLNAFRGNITTNVTLDYIIACMGDISSNFTTADYDAYTMVVYTVRYVKNYGISFGHQLLGVLLFFIPGGVWKNKPIGSGATVINTLTTGVGQNVSSPIYAESYINFGVLGVVSILLVLGYWCKRFDAYYWNKLVYKESVGKLIYCVSVPFFLFICRGDLLSTISFYIGFIVVTIVLFSFNSIFMKQNA